MRLHGLEQQVQDVSLVAWIEVAGRLVRQYQLWRWQQGTTDRHTLLFTLRQTAPPRVELVAQAHLLQQLPCPLAHLAGQLEGTCDAIGMQDVIQHIQIVKQLEILEHETDAGDAKITAGGITQCTDLTAATVHRPCSGTRMPATRFSSVVLPDHWDR